MIDLAKIQYRVVVMDESKNQYNIKEYIEICRRKNYSNSVCRISLGQALFSIYSEDPVKTANQRGYTLK